MFGFATKIGMTRLFIDGKAVAVTALQVAQASILQSKNTNTDGYNAVQIGAFPKTHGSKASKGHNSKHGSSVSSYSIVKEFRNAILEDGKQSFSVDDFQVGDLLDISGTTIGKGFTGVVKRWGFAGQPATHGHDHVRAPGSIGSRWPQRVGIGKKMAGHSGTQQRTLKNVKIIAIDPEKKLIFVNGSVQGANSSHVSLKKTNK
jgi:large subunit ribosomal protein L3